LLTVVFELFIVRCLFLTVYFTVPDCSRSCAVYRVVDVDYLLQLLIKAMIEASALNRQHVCEVGNKPRNSNSLKHSSDGLLAEVASVKRKGYQETT